MVIPLPVNIKFKIKNYAPKAHPPLADKCKCKMLKFIANLKAAKNLFSFENLTFTFEI